MVEYELDASLLAQIGIRSHPLWSANLEPPRTGQSLKPSLLLSFPMIFPARGGAVPKLFRYDQAAH